MKRRIINIILALVLCFSMTVPVLAAESKDIKVLPSITVKLGTEGLTATITNVYDHIITNYAFDAFDDSGIGSRTFMVVPESTVVFNQDVLFGSTMSVVGDEIMLRANTIYSIAQITEGQTVTLEYGRAIHILNGRAVSNTIFEESFIDENPGDANKRSSARFIFRNDNQVEFVVNDLPQSLYLIQDFFEVEASPTPPTEQPPTEQPPVERPTSSWSVVRGIYVYSAPPLYGIDSIEVSFDDSELYNPLNLLSLSAVPSAERKVYVEQAMYHPFYIRGPIDEFTVPSGTSVTFLQNPITSFPTHRAGLEIERLYPGNRPSDMSLPNDGIDFYTYARDDVGAQTTDRIFEGGLSYTFNEPGLYGVYALYNTPAEFFGETQIYMTYLVINVVGESTTPTLPPRDQPSSWAVDIVNAAIAKGFVPEDLQSSYLNVITRQEFCRMAVRWVEFVLGQPIGQIVSERGDPDRARLAFSDTSDRSVMAAFQLGIISGTVAPSIDSPGIFSPDGQFDRQSAAQMIMQACKVIGSDVSGAPQSGFVDASQINPWTVDGVNYCVANGIIRGHDGNIFDPAGLFTREMSIVIFDNIDHDKLPGR